MGNGCTSIKSVQNVARKDLLKLKFVVVGDTLAGKTSVVERFEKNRISPVYDPTKSVNIVSVVKKINVPNQGIVSVELWDIPGHERSNLLQTYLVDADAVIVVVDISCDDALDHAARWKQDVMLHLHQTQSNQPNSPKTGQDVGEIVPVLLLGNKYDLAKKAFLSNQYSASDEKISFVSDQTKSVKLETSQENSVNGSLSRYQPTTSDTEIIGSQSVPVDMEALNSPVGPTNDSCDDATMSKAEPVTSLNEGSLENGKEGLKKITLKELALQYQKSTDDKHTEESAMVEDSGLNSNNDNETESWQTPPCVAILEEFGLKNGFVAGIPVSAAELSGGVHEAIQSLIRRLLRGVRDESDRKRKTNESLNKSNNIKRTRKTAHSHLAEGYEPLQEVGLVEIDECITNCNAPLKEAQHLSTLYTESVRHFKKVCYTSRLVEDVDVSIEECISALRCSIEESLTSVPLRLVAVEEEGCSLLDVVDVHNKSAGDVITDDVILTLHVHNEQIHGSCTLISSRSSEVERSLQHHIDKISLQEQKAWDVAVAAGLDHSAVKTILSVIAQDKTRMIGCLEELMMTKKSVETLQSKIKAALLF